MNGWGEMGMGLGFLAGFVSDGAKGMTDMSYPSPLAVSLRQSIGSQGVDRFIGCV